MRAAVYLVLTPFLLCIGWAALASALVEATGQADETIARVLVSASSLLMIPLGVAFGRRYRQRSLRLPARLFLTPILLFFGCWFLTGFVVYAAGQESRFDGPLGTIVALAFLLTVPLGVGFAWRYRNGSLRLPAHLILTPIVLYFGWVVLWALLAWATGQDWMVSGSVGATAYVVAFLMLPLGIGLGWHRYRIGRAAAA